MNLQRKNHQGGKNLKHVSALAQILQIEKIAILFYIELHIQLLWNSHIIYDFFFEGLYSQKIKTLKYFKIKNKENKIYHGRGNSLRNKIEFQTYFID